jgi:hypothetical protein
MSWSWLSEKSLRTPMMPNHRQPTSHYNLQGETVEGEAYESWIMAKG